MESLGKGMDNGGYITLGLMKRIAVALACAPVIVLLTLSIALGLLVGGNQGSDLAFVLLTFGLPATYASAVLVGVPVFLIFRRRGWLKLWQVALGGAACALPFLAAWFWGNLAGLRYSSGVFVMVSSLGIGSLVALAFTTLVRLNNEA